MSLPVLVVNQVISPSVPKSGSFRPINTGLTLVPPPSTPSTPSTPVGYGPGLPKKSRYFVVTPSSDIEPFFIDGLNSTLQYWQNRSKFNAKILSSKEEIRAFLNIPIERGAPSVAPSCFVSHSGWFWRSFKTQRSRSKIAFNSEIASYHYKCSIQGCPAQIKIVYKEFHVCSLHSDNELGLQQHAVITTRTAQVPLIRPEAGRESDKNSYQCQPQQPAPVSTSILKKNRHQEMSSYISKVKENKDLNAEDKKTIRDIINRPGQNEISYEDYIQLLITKAEKGTGIVL